MRALIAELSDASPRFRELWDRAEVGYRLGFHHLRHPQVGELFLYRHRLNAPYPVGPRAGVSRRARKRFRQSVGGIACPVEAGAVRPRSLIAATSMVVSAVTALGSSGVGESQRAG